MNKVQYNKYKKILNKAGYYLDLKKRINDGDKNTFVKILDKKNTVTILMSDIIKLKIKRLKKSLR